MSELKTQLQEVLPQLPFTEEKDPINGQLEVVTYYKGLRLNFSVKWGGYLRVDANCWRLPKVEHRDRQQFNREHPDRPNRVKKLRANAIIKLMDFEVVKYNYLKNLSDKYMSDENNSTNWLKDNGFEKYGDRQYRIYNDNTGSRCNPLNLIEAEVTNSGLSVLIPARNFTIDGDKDKTLSFWREVQKLVKKYE